MTVGTGGRGAIDPPPPIFCQIIEEFININI